jgi:histidine ammonia-lyase
VTKGPPLRISGSGLTLADLLSVARPPFRETALDDAASSRVAACRAWVEEITHSDPSGMRAAIYGCNTGFGINREIAIPEADLRRLSRNLLVSHATGVGPDFPEEIVRGAILLRANALAKGLSGCRVDVVSTLLAMLDKGVTPCVPIYGSVGGSGDLAPLSHMALVLSLDPDEAAGVQGTYDSGRARLRGREGILPGAEAMRAAGIPRLLLLEKEALALNNGTQFITSVTALAAADASRVAGAAVVAAAMTLEAIRGNADFLEERLHAARGFPGQMEVSAAMRRLIEGSRLVFDYAADHDAYLRFLEEKRTGRSPRPFPKEGIHSAYSIRCSPQVLGAALDAIGFVAGAVEREMNSANDNPLIFLDAPRDNKSFSGGNFHGEPVAMAADFLKIALCEIGGVSERRAALLLDSKFSRGLPDFLIEDGGLNSGLMVTQYMAAGLVAENRVLAHPASVDSLPTGNGFEDHVSMGTHGARQAREILGNVATIVAVEILCAAQALHLRERRMAAAGETFAPGRGTRAALDAIRALGVEPYLSDRSPSPDIDRLRAAVLDGRFTPPALLG